MSEQKRPSNRSSLAVAYVLKFECFYEKKNKPLDYKWSQVMHDTQNAQDESNIKTR